MAERTLIIPDGWGVMRMLVTSLYDRNTVYHAELIPYPRGKWFKRGDCFTWQTRDYSDGTPMDYEIKFEVLT